MAASRHEHRSQNESVASAAAEAACGCRQQDSNVLRSSSASCYSDGLPLVIIAASCTRASTDKTVETEMIR